MSRATFSFLWSDDLGEAIKAASVKPYPVECWAGSPDFEAICTACNQGIDSRLEAIFVKQSGGGRERVRFEFEAASIPVLVRRLMEGDENAESLASGICETLGIELI